MRAGVNVTGLFVGTMMWTVQAHANDLASDDAFDSATYGSCRLLAPGSESRRP